MMIVLDLMKGGDLREYLLTTIRKKYGWIVVYANITA